MRKYFKQLPYATSGTNYYDIVKINAKNAIVLNNVFSGQGKLNVSKAFIEIEGVQQAKYLSLYWDKTGSLSNFADLDNNNADVIKLDYVEKFDNESSLCVFDVTKVLATLFKNNENSKNERYILTGTDIPSTGINCSITIYYDTIFGIKDRKATIPFELKNLNSSVDLSDGSLHMKYVVNNGYGRVPATVIMYYNSNQETELDKIYLDNGSFIRINYWCGRSWKLNFEQYIVEEKSTEFMSDGESVAYYTWINAQGIRINFSEQYFATINGIKKYLKTSQVTANADGTFSYTENSITYSVKHIYKCDQLYKLNKIAISATETKIEILNVADSKTMFEQTDMFGINNVVIFRLKTIEDCYGNALNVSYDQLNRIKEIVSVGGNTVVIDYDEDSDLVYKIKDKISVNQYIETTFLSDAYFNLTDIITSEHHRDFKFIFNDEDRYVEMLLTGLGNGYYFEWTNDEITNTYSIAKNGGIVDGKIVPLTDTKDTKDINNVMYKCVNLYVIDYFDYYTEVEEMRNNVETIYLFDYFGNQVNSYVNNYDGEGNGTPQGEWFVNTQENLSIQTKNVFGCDDLCQGAITYEKYFKNIDDVGTKVEKTAINSFIAKVKNTETADKNVYYTTGNSVNSFQLSLTYNAIKAIKESDVNNFVVSTWVMAKSFPIQGYAMGYKPEYKDETMEYSLSDGNKTIREFLENYRQNRLFQLSVKIVYAVNDDGEEDADTFSASFDSENPNFQQLQIPIRLRKNERTKIRTINIQVNYYNNNGSVYIYGTSMKSGSFKLEQTNEDKSPIFSRPADLENYYTEYYYNADNLPLDIHIFEEENWADEYAVDCEYNNHKSLTKITDSKNLVHENIYDLTNGDLLKTKYYKTYGNTDSGAIVEGQTYYPESGNVETTKNYFEVTDARYQYIQGQVKKITPALSADISYSYDKALNLVENMTATSEDVSITTENTYLKNETLSNSDSGASFSYDYDGFGRITKITIDGEDYCSIEYKSKDEKIVTYANGEKKTDKTDNQDKEFSVYCTDRDGKGGNNTAIEMTLSSYGSFKQLEDNIGGGKVKAQYDSSGRLSKWSVENKEDHFFDAIVKNTYDQNGRVSSNVFEHENNNTDVVTYTYQPGYKGKITDATHTAIGKESLSYDELERVFQTTKNSGVLRKEISYLDGETESENLTTNLVHTEKFYDLNLKPSGNIYYYDLQNRLTIVYESGIIHKKYTYDAFGRLSREDNLEFGKTFEFVYDKAGNILKRNEYNYTEGVLPIVPVTTFDYTYDATHKNRLLSYNGETCGNYEIGNPWVYRGHNLKWKNVHRLASYDNITFCYNYAGIRNKKTVNGVTTKYAINEEKILSEQKGSNTTTRIDYYYGFDGVTAFKYANTVYYYEKNVFGDILAIYDNIGNLIAKYVYDVWGNHKVLNPNGTENTNASFIGNISPFRYRSYYFDVETGLYYLQSRYYDPQVGRFISMDQVEYLAPDVVNGLNLYAYCLNNPVMSSDTNGTFIISGAAVLTGLGYLAGALFGVGLIAYTESETHIIENTIIGVGDIISDVITPQENSETLNNSISGVIVDAVIGEILYRQTRETEKEKSKDKPSWVYNEMIDPKKTPQQNATDILNNKYGPGKWIKGPKSEFNEIVKWIVRYLKRYKGL